MFPVQIGYERDVAPYADSLVNGEQQLLVSVEGNIFLTNGDGTYTELEGNNAKKRIEALKTIISDIEAALFSEIHLINLDMSKLTSEILAVNSDIENINESIIGIGNAISEISGNVNSNTNDINDLNDTISDLENRVYTKEEIDNLKIPATNITVKVNQGGVQKTISLQEAMNQLFSGNLPQPPIAPAKAVCGSFKAGQVKCGQGTAIENKSICGTFKCGERKVSSL